jgi:ABC-2 type transport system permease protein
LEESLKRLINNEESIESNIAIESRSSVLFNPDTRSANFFLPGLIVWEIPAITIVLVLLAFVKETETGTIEQLSITPISPAGFIIGKMFPYMMLAFLLVIEILIITRYVFQVGINGSVFLLLSLTVPYILASASLGAALSGKANTQIDAMQLGLIFRVFPPFYFTGYVFPLESSPEIFQTITRLIPERYLMEICRGIIIRGTTFESLWIHCLVLTLMSFATLFLAIRVYRKKLQ